MGSGLDDWVYWQLFATTVNYNSSYNVILLTDVCLANLTALRLLSLSLSAALISEWAPLLPESESYVTTDGQSARRSWNKAPIWSLRPDFYYCSTVEGLLMWGALLTRGSVIYNCFWRSPAQSFSGPSPVGLAIIFYFSSPPTTHRGAVEVFDPAATRLWLMDSYCKFN
jgi:hypothetical protein